MKSPMKHIFSEVPHVDIQRSTFDRSHGHKTTFDAGNLVPILVDEALPGDTFNVSLDGFARLATPIYPIMDNMRMETFFFAVPYRLVWENWEKFCGQRENPTDSIDYLVPQITDYASDGTESLYDYFGIPCNVGSAFPFSALPFRAYNLIWNTWFRDQNLQNSVTVDKDNGPDAAAQYPVLKRGKRHDYFTSALPWTQKGDDVLLSLGTEAPIIGIGKSNQGFDQTVTVYDNRDYSNTTSYGTNMAALMTGGAANYYTYLEKDTRAGKEGYAYIRADLTQAIGPSVNEFREAVQTQRILERDARAGSRYTEIIQSHFGVSSPDARLQRPEYLGGGSTPVHITPIANTSNTNTGKLGAMGIAAFQGHGFTKSFTEHCIIIGLVNVRADLTYQQGLERMWSRRTRYDFYWPALANLGEQAILNKELYIDAADIADDTINEVFGYQERYAEYRYKPSKITGKFRSADPASLESWHLSQEFTATPALNAAFIVDNPPLDRCIAVPTEPHFIFDSYINMRCTRPMPLYSVPGLVDHF